MIILDLLFSGQKMVNTEGLGECGLATWLNYR